LRTNGSAKKQEHGLEVQIQMSVDKGMILYNACRDLNHICNDVYPYAHEDFTVNDKILKDLYQDLQDMQQKYLNEVRKQRSTNEI